MSFSVKVEADWILAEDGVNNLVLEDAVTNLVQENAPAWLDLTGYIVHDSVTIKFNTLDFALIDPPALAVHLKEDVAVTDPSWTGGLASIETTDPTEQLGHLYVRVTATNTRSLPTDTAPFDLSETPANGTFNYLLEDGSGKLTLEDGTDFAPGAYLTEGPLAYDYSNLAVRTQVNLTGPTTTLGSAKVYQPGLRPGNAFKLTSTNQGYSAAPFQVNQIIVTWPADAATPFYVVEFGDTPQTLAQWTQITAPSPIVPVAPPVVVPLGTVIYGNCSAGHVTWPIGGGIVTIASATFTVSVPSGHTMNVQLVGQIDCRAFAWDNYIATPRRAVRGVISGGIFTGAWQETPAGTATTAGARGTYDLSSAPGISLPSGTYTVSIQIDTQEANQMEVFSAYAQAAVTTV